MKFDLVRPCPKCPFRTDCLEGWLGEARASEIALALAVEGRTFACHETTHHDDETGEYDPRDAEQHCAGALLVIEASGAANQLVQIAERLGLLDPEPLDRSSPTFPDFEAFIAHHASVRGGKTDLPTGGT